MTTRTITVSAEQLADLLDALRARREQINGFCRAALDELDAAPAWDLSLAAAHRVALLKYEGHDAVRGRVAALEHDLIHDKLVVVPAPGATDDASTTQSVASLVAPADPSWSVVVLLELTGEQVAAFGAMTDAAAAQGVALNLTPAQVQQLRGQGRHLSPMPMVAPVIADYAAHLDRMTARFLEEAGASGMADPAGEVLQSARELLVALAAVGRAGRRT
jgi:hypothetical protein